MPLIAKSYLNCDLPLIRFCNGQHITMWSPVTQHMTIIELFTTRIKLCFTCLVKRVSTIFLYPREAS